MKTAYFYLILAIIFNFSLQSWGQDFSPAEEEFLSQISPQIYQGLQRRDTSHPLFHGSVDWHSAVHAHFALLRLDRLGFNSYSYGSQVAVRLSPEAIEKERTYLRNHPDFEMPYGRAWFLQLCLEFERWSEEVDHKEVHHLRPMADEVANSLLARWQRMNPSPARIEYQNDSWAIYQLHEYFKYRKRERELAQVKDLIREFFLESDESFDFFQDYSKGWFFSNYGNWAFLISQTLSQKEFLFFLKVHPIAQEALNPINEIKSDHHLGMNWSRLWAFKGILMALPPDNSLKPQLESAIKEHTHQGLIHHQAYERNFGVYGHWVPQFVVFALTFDRSRLLTTD